jgi:hypothetical protein
LYTINVGINFTNFLSLIDEGSNFFHDSGIAGEILAKPQNSPLVSVVLNAGEKQFATVTQSYIDYSRNIDSSTNI